MHQMHVAAPEAVTSSLKINHPPNNGAIHNVAEIIKAVMSSAAEMEMGYLYINTRKI
jgi:hypothetical protein